MISQHHKANRWRPRFSVRTLVVVVTLMCCYAACWEPTRTQGVASLARWNELTDAPVVRLGPGGGYFHTSALAPLIVTQDEDFYDTATRRYYFWFFGYVAKFPHEREIKVLRLPVDFDLDVIDILQEADEDRQVSSVNDSSL